MEQTIDSASSEPVDDEISSGEDSPRESTLMSVLRLMRIPNVFTAIADVIVGFVFVHNGLKPWESLGFLILATCCFYSAGMVLNDLFDLDKDRKERPERPIPSGAISPEFAGLLGWGLLAGGMIFSTIAFLVHPIQHKGHLTIGFEPAMVGALLVIAILSYNKLLKKTPLAPLVMGSCRFLNILLGMSLIARSDSSLIPVGLMIAGGMGVYVAGFTWFARGEASESNVGQLVFGLLIMILGLGMVIAIPYLGWPLPATVNLNKPHLLPFLIGIMSLSVIRHALVAIADPIPRHVQITIKQSIFSLILFHAGICLWICSHNIQPALVVLVLLFPAILLGRWFYST